MLTRADGWGLYLLAHRTERVLVCPLVPDDLHEDISDRIPAPPCIAVPADAVRATRRLQDRLLPHYARALDEARRAQMPGRALAQPASLLPRLAPPPCATTRRR
ncbi:hypothetical protein ACFWBX_11620 [Streptomyces sp. NPDC059991]|uniref:hypothetical protein n=1 Tax=Streptomyces sp. NPDC059991 TaxID=3347028 RepID=UPI00367E727D